MIKRLYLKIVILYTFIISPSFLFYATGTEIKKIGNSFISNYTPKEFNFNRQTWDICTGNNNLVYFANDALLVAGNRHWKSYQTTTGSYIRSVFAINEDTILVGATGEIGQFVSGNLPGELTYQSLMSKLDSSFHQFGAVWQIIKADDKIFLRAGTALFEYTKDTIITLQYSGLIEYIDWIDNTLFIQKADTGLGTIQGGIFKILPYGSIFAEAKVVRIESISPNNYFIFTDELGAFRIKGTEITPAFNSFFNLLNDDKVARVRMIHQKYFAVGTVKEGVYIIDSLGNIIQHTSKKVGLQNNTIISMTLDKSNNLWLGLDNGISYIELNSCLTKINSESDIGTGYISVLKNDLLYLGTNQGLYYTNWKKELSNNGMDLKIEPVINSSGQVWCFFETKDKLYCGHHKGIYLIESNVARYIDDLEGVWKIDSLELVPGYYISSTYRGFFLHKLNSNNQLIRVKKLKNLSFVTRTFHQDKEGYIWFTSKKGLIRFRIDPHTLEADLIEVMNQTSGIESSKKFSTVGNNRQVFISTDQGIFNYNPNTQSFSNNPFYEEKIGKGTICSEFFEDKYNRIWYVTASEIGYFSLHFGKTEKTYLPFARLFHSHTPHFGCIGIIDETNILFGVDEGFYHYKSNCNEIKHPLFKTFITGVDSYQKPKKYIDSDNNNKPIPVYSHKKNSFSFAFTSNMYIDPDNIYYKYRLKGLEENWSDWKTRNLKEYNNLFEGTYVFEVKACNKYETETEIARFTFIVKPPIYRSMAAYGFYLLILLLVAYIIKIQRGKKLEIEKQKIAQKKQLELDEKRKHYEEEQLKAKQQITELINEKLEQNLLHKAKELSNTTINLLRKNKIMLGLKSEMQELYLEKNLRKRDDKILSFMKLIDREINTKKDWEIFDSNFNAVHENFIHRIQKKYPGLNQSDIRLCTFLKMNKTTKEIATLMNMSTRGVETSRYRLRKKMGLSHSANLLDEISNI